MHLLIVTEFDCPGVTAVLTLSCIDQLTMWLQMDMQVPSWFCGSHKSVFLFSLLLLLLLLLPAVEWLTSS